MILRDLCLETHEKLDLAQASADTSLHLLRSGAAGPFSTPVCHVHERHRSAAPPAMRARRPCIARCRGSARNPQPAHPPAASHARAAVLCALPAARLERATAAHNATLAAHACARPCLCVCVRARVEDADP